MDIGKDNLLLNTLAKVCEVFRDNRMLCGLTFPELVTCHVVLANDSMNKPTRAKDLAEALKVSKPAVSKLLSCMEEKGLVKRERREEDRKAVYVVLSEGATRVLEEQKATASVITKQIFAEMGTDKAKEFIAAVDHFYECYKKVEGKA